LAAETAHPAVDRAAAGRPVLPRQRSLLPNLVVIGAMKAGTTSLHTYLDQHPLIAMSAVKEIDFFVSVREDRGPGWYAAHFDPTATIRGESSTSYTKYPQRPGVPERMAELIPDARLIYLVRDPIERTVSHYIHARDRRRERRALRDALSSLEDNPYVDPSRYAMQLERYLACFPPSQILVLSSTQLRDDPPATLNKVCDFLAIPQFAFETSTRANVSERRGVANPVVGLLESYRLKRVGRALPRSWIRPAKALNARLSRRVEHPQLDDETRRRVADWLVEDAERFRRLTGQSFADWSV
jgi:hypothetical protein